MACVKWTAHPVGKLTLLAYVSVAACQSAGDAVPFTPWHAQAIVNTWGGDVTVQATEIDPEALGYSHRPRAVYLWFRIRTFDELEVEHALDGDGATLRVFEHAPVPRLYIVEDGRAQVRSRGLTMLVRIRATLIDPLEGGRIRFDSEFVADSPFRT